MFFLQKAKPPLFCVLCRPLARRFCLSRLSICLSFDWPVHNVNVYRVFFFSSLCVPVNDHLGVDERPRQLSRHICLGSKCLLLVL